MNVTATQVRRSHSVQVSWSSGSAVSDILRKGAASSNVQNPHTQGRSYEDNNVPYGQYTYIVSCVDGESGSGSATVRSPGNSTFSLMIDLETTGSPFGSFAFLVPLTDRILEYLHTPGDITDNGATWTLAHQLPLFPNQVIQDTSLSLVQSSDATLVAVVRVAPTDGSNSGVLLGYEFKSATGWSGPVYLQAKDNSDGGNDGSNGGGRDGSHDGGRSSANDNSGSSQLDNVTASQALIESDRNGQDYLELLVPRGGEIFHYAYDAHGGINQLGELVAKFPPLAQGSQFAAVSLLQSSTDELVAITLVTPANTLEGYVFGQTHDRHDGGEHNGHDGHNGHTWQPFEIISDQGPITGVTGSPEFIQSNETTFDLIVPQGAVLNHYRLTGQDFQKGVWHLNATLPAPGYNNQAQAVSLALSLNALGHLELTARERQPQGGFDFMAGYVFSQQAGMQGTWGSGVPLRDQNGNVIVATDGSTRVINDGPPPSPPTPPPSNPPPNPIM